MKTFTVATASQQFNQVLECASTAPVAITEEGRPTCVLTTHEDYDSLMKLKHENLKREVQLGFDALDRGEISNRTLEQIAAEALEIHRRKSVDASSHAKKQDLS